MPVRLSTVVTTDTVNLRPAGGGALLVHALDQDVHAVPDAPVPEAVVATMRARIQDRVGYPVTVTSAVVGQRALPFGGLPVVGPIGARGYVVVTHSGVTLAPLLGELVARELCIGAEQSELSPYRPERFEDSFIEEAGPRSPFRRTVSALGRVVRTPFEATLARAGLDLLRGRGSTIAGMTATTVIGTGAIGGAVTRRLLDGGHDVVVWNRSPGRTAELVEAGAVPAESIARAASAGALILLTVTDHAAVRQCVAQLPEDLSGRTVVAMCTGTASDARAAASLATGLGARYSTPVSRRRRR